MLTQRESISVAILAVYVPSLFISIFVNLRHGFSRQLGFFYLSLFCGLRIAGAIMEILSQKNPDSITDAEWAAILSSIGLSPLLLAATYLLKRVNDLTRPGSIQVRMLQIIHLPCLLALVLAIVGGTKLSSKDLSTIKTAHDLLKAAGILFLVVFLVIVGIAGLTVSMWRRMPVGEHQVFIALIVALPFLAVRMLYTLLVDFANNNTFNILGGNALVQLGMSTIEEMIITIVFLIVGILAPRLGDQMQTKVAMAGGPPTGQMPMNAGVGRV